MRHEHWAVGPAIRGEQHRRHNQRRRTKRELQLAPRKPVVWSIADLGRAIIGRQPQSFIDANRGAFAAIDVIGEALFVGSTARAALESAKAVGATKNIYLARIGSTYTYESRTP